MKVRGALRASEARSRNACHCYPRNVLQEVWLFDLYSGEGLDTAEKSIAIGLIFQGISSTLIEEEVDAFVERVLIRLRQALGARLRGQRSPDEGAGLCG
jgi:phenylalanyl-tRNA synthetase beta subunit